MKRLKPGDRVYYTGVIGNGSRSGTVRNAYNYKSGITYVADVDWDEGVDIHPRVSFVYLRLLSPLEALAMLGEE